MNKQQLIATGMIACVCCYVYLESLGKVEPEQFHVHETSFQHASHEGQTNILAFGTSNPSVSTGKLIKFS